VYQSGKSLHIELIIIPSHATKSIASPHQASSHELPLYTFNTSLSVSYRISHSLGFAGAVADTVGQGCVFENTQFDNANPVPAEYVLLLSLTASHTNLPLV
jgi:hypothetical protein